MVRRAMVLSSGGSRGSFEVGVMEELILNRGLDFHIFCGISAGALNASVVAQAPWDPDPATSVKNLQEQFLALRSIWLERIKGTSTLIKKRFLGIGGVALGADSVYDTGGLAKLLSESVSPQRLAESKRALGIQYCPLETGELVTVTKSGEDIVKGVLASASVPFFFPPVVMDGKHLVDAGVRNNTPLGTAFDIDPPPDVIYIVYASPIKLEPASYEDSMLGFKVSARDYVMRTIEILLNEIDITDVEGARQLNTLKLHWERIKPQLPPEDPSVKAIEEVLKPIRYAKLIECRPEKLFVVDAFKFDPEEMRANYEHGKAMAAQLPSEEAAPKT